MIDGSQVLAQGGGVHHVLDQGVQQLPLGGEDAEQGPLGDPGGLGHLARGEARPLLQQHGAGGSQDGRTPLVGGQRSGSGGSRDPGGGGVWHVHSV